jgi:D-methionine transport system ATP-binding protein
MGKRIVQIAELSVYGEEDEVLLEDLSLTVEKGEIAQLPGFSNLQYVTLFDVLTGDLSPDSGQVVLCDRNIVRLSRKNRKKMLRDEVSFLPGNFIPPREKTILQSLKFKLAITGMTGDIQERTAEVLELTGLTDSSGLLPEETGEVDRIKTGLAISIVNRPELLVCHKPFSGLNSKGIEEVVEVLKAINEKLGLTVLLLTDDVSQDLDGLSLIESNLDTRVVK